MHCSVSCQINCGHVASTSIWARYLSFFALICPNYFGVFTTITHEEPNCFLWDASPTWNHQYGLSLREKWSICYHIITSSSHEKAAAAVFTEISHFLFRAMEAWCLFFLFFLWDNLLKEGWAFKKLLQYSMWKWGTLRFSTMESRRGFRCSLSWGARQPSLTISKSILWSYLCYSVSFLTQARSTDVEDIPIQALSSQLYMILCPLLSISRDLEEFLPLFPMFSIKSCR